jgi:eukaryotic-like serine/threonine-protein kinase
MSTAPGQLFGNYQVLRLIGEGGFGEVYEAENTLLRRRAAIKVLHAGFVRDEALVRRFMNEARAASGIHHPNIVEVFDAGLTPEGEPYILMEYLEGDSLQATLLKQGRLPLRTVQEIARQACSALSAAHSVGIVHRDLKPENIFLLADPDSPFGVRVKVLDFGIAKIQHRDGTDSTVKTKTGLIMGSPAYMSPEQCKDSSDVDHRSDIYSMGVIVYEMLSGLPPFVAKSTAEMLVLQLSAAPPSLRSQCPDLPEHVEQTVLRALSKNREERYDRVDYFVGALLGTYPATTSQGNAPSATTETSSQARAGTLPAVGAGLPGSEQASLSPPPPQRSAAPQAAAPSESKGVADAPLAPPDPSEDEDPEQDAFDFSTPRRPKAIIAVAIVIALGGAAALLFFLRGSKQVAPLEQPQKTAKTSINSATERSATATDRPAAPAMVRIQIGSVPSGAVIVDKDTAAILGQTPLDQRVAQGDGSLSLNLHLDGHQDETVTVSLKDSFSTSVELKRLPENQPALPTDRARHNDSSSQAHKRAKVHTEEEGSWIAH